MFSQEVINMLALLLFLVAIAIGIYGVVRIINGDLIWGVVLIILALIIGPGGYSIFERY